MSSNAMRAVDAVTGPAVAGRLADAARGSAHVPLHVLVDANPRLLVDAREAVPDMLRAFDGATRSIEVSEYILKPSGDGLRLLEALRARALGSGGRAPIEVSIMVDRSASAQFPGMSARRYYDGLERDGVRVLRHDAPLNPARGPSDHRKLFVIDGTTTYVGGMGFSSSSWHDLMVRVDGPVAAQAHAEFVGRWVDAGGTVSDLQRRLLHEADAAGQHPVAVGARLVANSPGARLDSTEATFEIARRARSRLWMHTPFFGSAAMADTLVGAAAAGVDTRLSVNGERGIPIFPLLSRSYYRQLVDERLPALRVLEQPSMSHEKVTLGDDWVSAGSMNIAPRALGADHELNVVSNDPGLRAQVTAMMRRDEAAAHRVTGADLDSLSVRLASSRLGASLVRGTLGTMA